MAINITMKNLKKSSQQKTSSGKTKLDGLWWFLIAALTLTGIVANIYYSYIALPIRIITWLFLTIVLLFIAYQTAFGKMSWQFLQDARLELLKVVWPTRQETVQTSLVVVAMVVIVALMLWGVDSLLLWAVGILTGQSG